ncbi:MAG: hypothetical protein AB8G23_20655 [Myxococcota bacterium]
MRRLRRFLLQFSILVGSAGLIVTGIIMLALRPPAPLPAPADNFILERVTLVEPGGKTRGPVRLEVKNGLIHSIRAAEAAAGAPFKNRFVIPGLTDMHAHLPVIQLPGDAEYTSLLMLLHGVTRVRLLGGVEIPFLHEYRERIEAGDAPGPRYFNCGPFLDGEDPVLPGARVITNAEEARSAVAELAAQGADCIKAYEKLNAESAIGLREAAQSHGIKIVGHTPRSVPFEIARFDDHQHLRGLHPPFLDESMDYPYFLQA